MDFQNRPGSKTGSGGVGTESDQNLLRRERMKKLAMETMDLANDPYFLKNHLGTYECKLCLTIHNNEGSYLAHTQGRKHQTNLARRAAKEAAQSGSGAVALTQVKYSQPKKVVVKIGRPGYKVTKVKSVTGEFGLLFQIHYPEIASQVQPQFRFMSSFEQRIEAPSRNHQYLLIAAEPYETIAFKIQSRDVDTSQTLSHFDSDTRQFTLQIIFK